MNRPTQYDPVSKLFHWLMAILVVGMLVVGFYMTRNESLPSIGVVFKLHKSVGMVVLLLIVARILWRLFHPAPALPSTVSAWRATAARSVHGLLYLSMLIMPLAGFLGASLSGRPLAFFGAPLPQWLPANPVLSHQLFFIHTVFSWVLVILISIHLVAAIVHWFAKDGVIKRMWF